MHSTNREHSGPSRHFCGLALINAGEIWVAIRIKLQQTLTFPKIWVAKTASLLPWKRMLVHQQAGTLEQVLTFGSLEWTKIQTQKNKNNNERHFLHISTVALYIANTNVWCNFLFPSSHSISLLSNLLCTKGIGTQLTHMFSFIYTRTWVTFVKIVEEGIPRASPSTKQLIKTVRVNFIWNLKVG